MSGLRELQQSFRDGIFDPESSAIGDCVRANGLSAPRRLQVYRNNIFSSLTDALGAIYPVVKKLVGDGFFGYACDAYIRQHPSTSGDLHDFGAEFGAFLGGFPAASALAYLPDVAGLEWYYHEVYHEAECAPLDLARLAQIDPTAHDQLRWRIHPARRWLRSAYPVLRIWQVNQEGHTGDDRVDLDVGGDTLLVARRDEIEFYPLSACEYVFLERLAAGDTLGQALPRLLETDANFDLGQCLQKLVANQTLVDFT